MKALVIACVLAGAFVAPAYATEQSNKKAAEDIGKFGKALAAPIEWMICDANANENEEKFACDHDIRDAFSENESGETDNDRDIADSGEEGSTSAASASDQ